ncbi:PSD1 and planctomycete cytochrome C domain-containing protein [Anatilimnocola floriformis]|uniref:PSD1 and planctomycete cytochrome C domain-containing protein n=1 Tax=Anatilimnocola floriformis TaxID=2948575 RepID=UPI0020C397DA|nr:PSD1 and planctomycete cytochrome C domain-containing protein [Anatilimnocola floriformis]
MRCSILSNRSLLSLACAGWLCLLAIRFASAAEPKSAPTPEQLKFFEEKVRPVLATNCFKCHGEEKQKGDLRLDLHEALLTGGESGPAIVPGNPKESLLLDAVNYSSLEMPPDGKLSESEIEILTTWVKIGAPWPKEHGGAGPGLRKVRDKITAADREYWAFQPVRRAALPEVESDSWSRGPIDRFLLARQQQDQLQPAPEAERGTLIRRVSFDLTGLPPTASEIAEFQNDTSPDAYERLVDRLLARPQHGEQWARHWLDLVRYAESDGYKQDDYRPQAWRYRDYVIRSINQDKPYPQFIREQLAGDELEQQTPDALVATGYLRLGIYEYNQRDVKGQWSVILNDITDVTSDVFLGMGLSCARCHDHKFDPILQKDYFALQAFFTPIMQRDDVTICSPNERTEYQQKLAAWEMRGNDILKELAELERQPLKNAATSQLGRFPDDIVPILFKEAAERTPYEQQLYALAFRQAKEEQDKIDFTKKLTGEKKDRWIELKEQLKELGDRPQPLPTAMTVSDVGPQAPPTMVPGKPRLGEVLPAIPTVLCTVQNSTAQNNSEVTAAAPMPPASLAANSNSTGRRTALAQWMGNDDNPLTPRVLANRLWQHHFGKGLCESPSDFGRLGQPPSHPALLDWLAKDFVEQGWNWKYLHRQIVTSAAYRQVSHGPETAASAKADPFNRLLARMPVRRLSAEQIRDSSLAVAGELNLSSGGPAVDAAKARRSVYVKVRRNVRDPLLDVFDVADGLSTMPTRNVTTTPIQALLMINGPWMISRGKAATTVIRGQGIKELDQQVISLYVQILGREPDDGELSAAVKFLSKKNEGKETSLADLAHVLLNSNEFVYVD